MPTFREDLHLGHNVALVERDDIAPGAVGTDQIGNGAVTPEKISDDFVETVIQPLIDDLEDKHDKDIEELRDEHNHDVEQLREKDADLQNQIDSLQISGIALSNVFGDDTHIGISQKTLTAAFNKVWEKIEDITGESARGIAMVVTPEYFIGEEGCDCHITATTVATNGIFDKIQFFGNGELIAEAENTEFFEYDFHIDETTVIMCKAKIMGIEYTEQDIIVHHPSFWLGAGTAYTDIMDVAHVIPIGNGMRGAYEVVVNDNDRIFVIVGDGLREQFIRADINGVEIPMTQSTATIDGKTYKVFTSDAHYEAGTYNIDING